MSGITQDQQDRFEAALQKMELAAATHGDFLKLPAGEFVQTEGGPLKSLATLVAEADAIGEEVGEFAVEIADHLNTLAQP